MVSARNTASRRSWVTSTPVNARSSPSVWWSSHISSRVNASSAANGSSRSRSAGSWISARQRLTRWRIPPESSRGCRRSAPSSPTVRRRASARSRQAARFGVRGSPFSRRISSGRSRLSRTVRHGSSTGFWNAIPTFFNGPTTVRPSTATLPRVVVSRPAISLSSVDLPQPLGPTNATVAPRGMSSDTPSSARTTRRSLVTYSKPTSRSDTATPRDSPAAARPIEGLGGRGLIELPLGRRRQVGAGEHLGDGRLGAELERDHDLLDRALHPGRIDAEQPVPADLVVDHVCADRELQALQLGRLVRQRLGGLDVRDRALGIPEGRPEAGGERGQEAPHRVLVRLEPVDPHQHGVAVEVDAVVAVLEGDDLTLGDLEVLGQVEEAGEVEAGDRLDVALQQGRLSEGRGHVRPGDTVGGEADVLREDRPQPPRRVAGRRADRGALEVLRLADPVLLEREQGEGWRVQHDPDGDQRRLRVLGVV